VAGTITITLNLSANGMRAANLFAVPKLVAKPDLRWIGIRVEAAQPIVAGWSHYDGMQPRG
jgi:hypothetical protein